MSTIAGCGHKTIKPIFCYVYVKHTEYYEKAFSTTLCRKCFKKFSKEGKIVPSNHRFYSY